MKMTFALILVMLATFVVGILSWALTAWIIIGLLHWLGIYTIGAWTVAFSWKFVLVLAIISSLFSGAVATKRD